MRSISGFPASVLTAALATVLLCLPGCDDSSPPPPPAAGGGGSNVDVDDSGSNDRDQTVLCDGKADCACALDQDCEATCEGPACRNRCSGTSTCSSVCAPGSECDNECAQSGSCDVDCADGKACRTRASAAATLKVDCAASGSCDVECNGGAHCDVDAGKAAGRTLQCGGGADCLAQCVDAGCDVACSASARCETTCGAEPCTVACTQGARCLCTGEGCQLDCNGGEPVLCGTRDTGPQYACSQTLCDDPQLAYERTEPDPEHRAYVLPSP